MRDIFAEDKNGTAAVACGHGGNVERGAAINQMSQRPRTEELRVVRVREER